MTPLIAMPLAPIILCLGVGLFLSKRFANRHPLAIGKLITRLAGAQLIVSLLVAAGLFLGEIESRTLSLPFAWTGVFSTTASDASLDIFLFDGLSCVMLALVSFLSVVVSRFSIRYLDGEQSQGTYFRALATTMGAVSGMIVAGNLLLFFFAWLLTSLGLHQLLLHYGHRPAARRAAWTKFTISRLGDLMLAAGLVMTYSVFGTLNLEDIFQQCSVIASSPSINGHAFLGWLLVIGAVTKSAQFPFHSWLPNTLETPTPVSALMHAGIVNAGGYLVIRTSPLIALSPGAFATLAAIGGFTACFGAIAMMTQPSIKRGLAYSTIAQMGFMMLQCGLGAFSAALLHIVAHSLYKAYAFLNSGSVIEEAAGMLTDDQANQSKWSQLQAVSIAFTSSLLACFIVPAAFGVNLLEKPGGLLLGAILCSAFTSAGMQLLRSGVAQSGRLAVISMLLASATYFFAFSVLDAMLVTRVPVVQLSPTTYFIAFDVLIAFLLLFALNLLLRKKRGPSWLEAVRIHAVNGFYVDAFLQRISAVALRR